MSNIHPISHVHVEHMGPPPSKMPRLGVEDTVYQRQQQSRHLELLCRLYPEQKRGVLELILKGCNNDVVQAIECILPSHERAIQQLSALPSQSYTLPVTSKGSDQVTRVLTHSTEKASIGSAFMPFSTQPHSITPHTFPLNTASCPPGCTCQQQKCECADCMNGNVIHAIAHHTIPHSHKFNSQVRPHMTHIVPASTVKISQQPTHRMVPYVPVTSHVPAPISEPVKICAGCGGKMKIEDQRCPNCEPEQKS